MQLCPKVRNNPIVIAHLVRGAVSAGTRRQTEEIDLSQDRARWKEQRAITSCMSQDYASVTKMVDIDIRIRRMFSSFITLFPIRLLSNSMIRFTAKSAYKPVLSIT